MKRLALFLVLFSLVSCSEGDSPASKNDSAGVPQPETTAGDKGNVTLTAADDVKVYGTLLTANENNDRIVLLFHQARSNRHEYDPIAPQLNELGFDTLAIDQRSGGTMWDHDNHTVQDIGESQQYLYALPDLQAAVDWAVQQEYKTIITVGSSYSAALNFILAKANADRLTAIASFSPGEYLGSPDLVKTATADVAIPVYVTAGSADKEQSQVDEVLSKTGSDTITRHIPEAGVHGASTLREDSNPDGAIANLAEFKKFLRSTVD